MSVHSTSLSSLPLSLQSRPNCEVQVHWLFDCSHCCLEDKNVSSLAWVKSALWWAWLTSGSFLNSFPHECWASDHFREQQKSLSWVCELDYGVFPVCKLHTCLLLPSHHLLFPLLVPPFFLELEEWSIMLSKVPHFILYFFVFPLFTLSLYCVNSYFISLFWYDFILENLSEPH